MPLFHRNKLSPECQFGRALYQISFRRIPPDSAGMTGFRQESVGQGKDLAFSLASFISALLFCCLVVAFCNIGINGNVFLMFIGYHMVGI
jgi:hypothetical protein